MFVTRARRLSIPTPSRLAGARAPRIDTGLTLLLVFLLTLPALAPAGADPGDIDPTFAGFGDGGRLDLPVSDGCMVVQPDGRVVLVGENSGGRTVWSRRLLANGAPDPSYGTNGTTIFSNPSLDIYPTCAALQSDGKIVFAGYAGTTGNPAHFMVGRFTPAGALDPTFDGDGIATTVFSSSGALGYSMVVQPDGRILVAGETTVGGDDDFAVARYLPTGALDSSFSGDGKLTFGFGGDDACYDMALQSDGSIILVGGNYGTLDDDFAVARVLANGTMDGGFDGDGKVTTGFGDSETAQAVALQPDGKIVVAGSIGTGDGKIARYQSNGALDSSFDGDGKLTLTQNDRIKGVVVQPDGKIVVLGTHTSPDSDQKFAFHRLIPNGSLDTTFDGDGDAFVDMGAMIERGEDLALLPDGRLLAYGIVSGIFTHTGLVRLRPDASLDVAGQQTLAFGNADWPAGSDEYLYGMAVQADGRVVVAGTVMNGTFTESDVVLARFLPDGLVDDTFGEHGRASLSITNKDYGRAVAIQPDGKIVVSGFTGTGNNVQCLVARFNTNGTPDNTFAFGGFNILDFLGGPDYIRAVAIAPDGKIVVAGTVFNGGMLVFGAARFNSDGTVDTTFDLDGKQLFDFPGGTAFGADAVLVQPDLKIVVGGTSNSDFALVRFNENGSVDGGFGGGGWTTTDMGGIDATHALALESNGRIYAAGGGGPNSDFAIAQYTSAGILTGCVPFGGCTGWRTGKWFVDWGGNEFACAIDVRHDGKVAAAGYVNGLLGWAQVNSSSTLGPIVSTIDLVGDLECESGESFTLGAVGVQYLFSDKVYLAGTQTFNDDHNFAVASCMTTQTTIPSVTGVDDNVESVRAVHLHAAHPNPLRHESALAFDLPQAQAARIRVFDVAGRLVRTLATGSFQAGRHRTTWDGTDNSGQRVAAGVYFARLDTGSVHEQQSVVVVR